ncbi:hypothetical protein [Roseateles amylovorans]|uniref:Prepilin-type N-terminal cleavage/methylation domain-containing protein n=1 Tax=Roseateles amylovorans TaxID=2978473 RepID=A0ABY6B4S7_9BURK|nr:hypothetical protein [Roseateles amylovorans]UXH80368.1 hypothetical protein N4261_11025 [Roseateles amylovorans]
MAMPSRRSRRGAGLPPFRLARGMTLIEIALASTLVVGLSVGFMLTLRMHQMVKLGEAAGEQLAAIDEGVNRYMLRHAEAIRALPAACADVKLVAGSTIGTAPSQEPDCKLTLNGETVQNGYQPTVAELFKLNYVRGADSLLLPYQQSAVKDSVTGQDALPRLAVSIVLEQGPTSDDPGAESGSGGSGGGSGGGGSIGGGSVGGGGTVGNGAREIAKFAMGSAGRLPLDYGLDGELSRVYDVDCLDTSIKEINVVIGSKVFTSSSGQSFCDMYRHGKPFTGEAQDAWKAKYPATLQTLYGIDCRSNIKIIFKAGSIEFDNGIQFCSDYVNAKLRPNIIKQLQETWRTDSQNIAGITSGTGTVGSNVSQNKPEWRLRSLVYNTQPYYTGNHALPFGASAQLAAALHAAGYKGRLAMPTLSPAQSVQLAGLQGTTQVPNPISMADASGGQPGILAAESWYYFNGKSGSGGGDDSSTLPTSCNQLGATTCRDGTAKPTAAWDFNQKDLINVNNFSSEDIKARQVTIQPDRYPDASSFTPVKQNQQGWRPTALKLDGNLQMGKDSKIAGGEAQLETIESKRLVSEAMESTGYLTVNPPIDKSQKNIGLYVKNESSIRLPRAYPGQKCDSRGYGDMALSYSGKLVNLNNAASANDLVRFDYPSDYVNAQNLRWQRFFLYCGSNGVASNAGERIWRSAEYETLTASKSKTHRWVWNDSAIPISSAGKMTYLELVPSDSNLNTSAP